jgi:hypothetical protein
MGLDGFWRYACERFFVLEAVMRATGIERCLHLENDNLLFVAPAELEPWLSATFGASIAVCPLTADEDTAAAMYVGSLAALSRFNAALLELVRMRPRKLLRTHGGRMANEMRMLHVLRVGMGLCEALPTTLSHAVETAAPFVFDPASYGQYLDGTPGNPGESYVTDVHEVGRELLAGRCELIREPLAMAPHVRHTGLEMQLPLVNLHIHSKRLARWAQAGAAAQTGGLEVSPPTPRR